VYVAVEPVRLAMLLPASRVKLSGLVVVPAVRRSRPS
jgi:hypothetical protein